VKQVIFSRNIVNSVPTAVWIATLIKTYINFEVEKNNNYWITQKDIQEIAKILCPKNIDNARISQWCNGDHPNNTYNYLKANGVLRRLTQIGEFVNKKEFPKEIPVNVLIFEDKNITLLDLIEWYKNIYCKIEILKDNVIKEFESVNMNFNIDISSKQTEDNMLFKYNNENEMFYEWKSINKRAIELIRVSWDIFSRKVGSGLISINKEASMQLQYSVILKQMLPLIVFSDDESVEIELETTITDGIKNREVDIMVIVNKNDDVYKIAVELKCYRTKASSGGNRGATDIFMKDVYQDIHLLERYCENNHADIGIALVMNDYKNFINPKEKKSKCWDYDISHGTTVENIHLATPIGGKEVDILLKNKYQFLWKEFGGFYFLYMIPQ